MELALLMQAVPGGEYVSLWKAIPALLLVLLWARLLTWVDKDTVAAHLPRDPINLGLVGVGAAGALLFLLTPDFPIALLVLFGIIVAGYGGYLVWRKQAVGLGDLQKQFKNWINSFTNKQKEVVAVEGQVQIISRDGQPMAAPDAEDASRAAYDTAQAILTDPMRKGMEKLEVIPAEGASAVRYWVDGVGYNSPAVARHGAAEAISLLKKAAKMDVEEKRKPQSGAVKLAFDNHRREVQITTAGSTVGEGMRLVLDPRKRHEAKLEGLGLTDKQLETLSQVIGQPGGIVLLAAPKDQGLTSLLYAVIRRHDAFLSHIITLERDPQDDLEGITQNRLPASARPQEELEKMQWIISQEPDVVLVNGLENSRSAAELIRMAATKRVYVGLRAGNTFDAVNVWKKLVGDDRLALSNLKMAVSGRVMRRLCEACKLAYHPDPDTLRKLNMDPQRVSRLFQARSQPLRDPKGNVIPCTFCHDLHFKGRFGVYEVLNVDDEVRQVLGSGTSAAALKTSFRKQRGVYLQEAALLRVEAGDTSVQEVLRVLRGEK